MDKLVCYCFGYSEADIGQDVRDNNGRSLILEKIRLQSKMAPADAMRRIPRENDAFLMSTVLWTG